MEVNKKIKESLKGNKIIMGTRQVKKNSKRGLLEMMIYSSNIPKTILNDLEHYSKVSNIGLEPFGDDSVKLGQVCGKPFKILVIGIKKWDLYGN